MSARIGLVGDIVGDIGFSLQEAEGRPFRSAFDESVTALCHSHDELWGNLEGPCRPTQDVFALRRLQRALVPDVPRFLVPHHWLAELRELGFTVLSVANNHCFDFNDDSDPEVTESMLCAADIEAAGRSLTPVIRVVDGRSFAIFSVTTVMNRGASQPVFQGVAALGAGPEDLCDAIRLIRRDVDVVVVMVHWGRAFARKPNHEVGELAARLIDEGVDVVVGSHPHVLWPIVYDKRQVVAFSLGTFTQVPAVPSDAPYYSYLERSLHTGVLTLTVTGDRIEPAFTPVRLRHNFDQWYGEGGIGKCLWQWDGEDIERWQSELHSRRTRLQCRLEVSGASVCGGLTLAQIDEQVAAAGGEVPCPQ